MGEAGRGEVWREVKSGCRRDRGGIDARGGIGAFTRKSMVQNI